MNYFNVEVNRIFLQTSNQILEPTFPYISYDNEELESNKDNNNNEIGTENSLILNKIFKEGNIYRPKNNKEINAVKLDDIGEFTFDCYFITNNDNNEKVKCLSKDKKIFEIVKTNKKIGRIKKNSFLKGTHNKLSEDNIIRKIKARFLEKLRLYINFEYKKYLLNKTFKKKKIINWLKKINPKISRNIKKRENLKWFKTKVYEIFSENVSLKYSFYSPDLNKKKIKRLISSNEAEDVISILNNDIETIFEKYVNNEKIEGFKTLKDDIEELRAHMEKSNLENINEYLEKYEYVAKNLKKIFEQKSERSYRRFKVNK